MQPADTPVESYMLGDLCSNPRGGKHSNFASPVRLLLNNVTTPFDVSSFDGVSDRKSLDLRTDEATRDFCARLDKHLISQASKIGCRADGYKSLMKTKKRAMTPSCARSSP